MTTQLIPGNQASGRLAGHSLVALSLFRRVCPTIAPSHSPDQQGLKWGSVKASEAGGYCHQVASLAQGVQGFLVAFRPTAAGTGGMQKNTKLPSRLLGHKQ
jgi:hypothetical protein